MAQEVITPIITPHIAPKRKRVSPMHQCTGVTKDIDAMLLSMEMYAITRYKGHRFWELESQEAEYAAKIETSPRLESNAEHSWHVADTTLLLCGRFPQLDSGHCVKLAIIHDKLEIFTGDKNPIGKNGNGSQTHAFNHRKRVQKETDERVAMMRFVRRLRRTVQAEQLGLFAEVTDGVTPEARFVKAVDKLQALAFVMVKKRGVFDDRHLDFTLRYSRRAVDYFPGIRYHYEELRARLLQETAQVRKTTVSHIENMLRDMQLTLDYAFEDE